MTEPAQNIPDNNILTSKPSNKDKKPYSYQKNSAYDKKALALLKEDPTLTPYQIGMKLKTLGKAKSDKHIYNRLKRNHYLSAEFAKVEQAHIEHLSRITLPLASKRMDNALKDKDMDNTKAFPYVKLAYDKALGETHRHIGQQTVNVENIEKLQVVIGNDLAGTLAQNKASST